ncbi:MAG: 4-hydroxy-tetrahydrodipicolinate reductase [Myxococcota bacterium]|nr:4-hydroxy-tetrahydrodipicolinate reductase [Myxococcota bacterium]
MLVLGALGRMGERVRAALAEDAELRLGAAVEAPDHPGQGRELEDGVRVGDDAKGALPGCELAIAFASPEATLALLREAADAGVPCVVGTTGFDDAARQEIAALAERTPLLLAANFSVAVNVLFHLARRAAELLGPGFDAEIVELHHGAKVDAPSGTALRLGQAVAEGRGESLEGRAVLAREGHTGPRPEGAIGIQTLRGGDNPGEHTLYFVGRGERLELVHRSATRDHFARGAVRAARWLRGRAPGLYDMEQVLGLRD